MPLDKQMQAILLQMESLQIPPNEQLTPDEAREFRKLRPLAPGPETCKVSNVSVYNDGISIPVRVYEPAGSGPFPILVWYHGGGWVLGNIETADPISRHLCEASNFVVMSVDYRLAPESKFPAAVIDALAVAEWASKQGHIYNGDPELVAVGGDSAGGNLATVVAIKAKQLGSPNIFFQLLVYPVTDFNFETKSYIENSEGYSLTRNGMKWFWDHYLNDENDSCNPDATPMNAESLEDLPPALIITAEFDPLRDEGELYGEKLQNAGVNVTISRYDGVVHGFFTMTSVLDLAKNALKEAANALKSAAWKTNKI
jgi:acetyl esterase